MVTKSSIHVPIAGCINVEGREEYIRGELWNMAFEGIISKNEKNLFHLFCEFSDFYKLCPQLLQADVPITVLDPLVFG